MKLNQRKICQAVLLAAYSMAASAAMAAAPALLSGGSSLVAPSITAEGSIFPAADGTFSYHSANSSTGQTAFLTNAASLYGSTVTGTVDFGNSDSALTGAQVTAYDTAPGLGATNGLLIQIPYVTTPITIPLTNAPTGTGPALPTDPAATPTVALNDDDLCGIFSGKLTNWNQVINPVPATPTTYSLNQPIQVVYRTDGSGTTDLLTRHLHAVCNSTNTASGVTFLETQTFASNFTAGVPSTFHGASGSGAVADELVTLRGTSTIGAVGYLSPDYTNTFLAPSSASASSHNLSVASLHNTTSGANVVPTAANASAALAGFTPPTGNMIGTPAADPTLWVPAAGNPAAGYPISGTTNIILSQCYANPLGTSPSPSVAVIDFLNLHYSNASNAAIITGNGFTTVPSSYSTAIIADFVSPPRTSTGNLNIGNTSICTGTVTGR